jgi:hypothetical protein
LETYGNKLLIGFGLAFGTITLIACYQIFYRKNSIPNLIQQNIDEIKKEGLINVLCGDKGFKPTSPGYKIIETICETIKSYDSQHPSKRAGIERLFGDEIPLAGTPAREVYDKMFSILDGIDLKSTEVPPVGSMAQKLHHSVDSVKQHIDNFVLPTALLHLGRGIRIGKDPVPRA